MKSSEFHRFCERMAGTMSALVDLTTFMRKMGGLTLFPIMVVRKLERAFAKKS